MTDPAPRCPRTGGRVAGKAYAPPPPKDVGEGHFPYKDYSAVQPRALRDTYAQWQDICLDIREQRFALGREQKDVAAELGISVSTLQRVETGDWVDAHVLLRVASVLQLEIWQAVEVRRNSPPGHRRRR